MMTNLHSPIETDRRGADLREASLQAAARAQLPEVDSFLGTRSQRLSVKLCELVDHAAFLAHSTTRFLRDTAFDGPVIFLGRDAGPVALGVRWCAQSLGLEIPIRLMNVSNKFFISGWDSAIGGQQVLNDRSFITRLIHDEITPSEARASLLWRFFTENGLGESGRCLFIDNGVNGTLLSRLNQVLNICDPSLEIHNSLMYYSGAVTLPRVQTIVRERPQPGSAPTTADYVALGDFSHESVKLEAWPHPYPSLSHFEVRDDRAVPAYEPSRDITSEGVIEAEVDWNLRALENMRALRSLRAAILE